MPEEAARAYLQELPDVSYTCSLTAVIGSWRPTCTRWSALVRGFFERL